MRDDNEPTEGLFDRTRPYYGQAQTFVGERGKYTINDDGILEQKFLTVRDIYDSVLIGICHSIGVDPEALDEPEDLYHQIGPKLTEMDVVAAAQNACREVEKRLGIYPNTPSLGRKP